MIHAYTGEGKGKTTASVGLLIRAFGSGKKVMIIFFDKGSETYRHNELIVFDRLGIEYHVTGLERMQPNGKFRFGVIEEDKKEAIRGVNVAEEALKSEKYDLIVLDEALSAMSFGLLDENSLIELIKLTPKDTELILTGRCKDKKIFEYCDLVTSMTKEKHYFDKGVQARPGIEY